MMIHCRMIIVAVAVCIAFCSSAGDLPERAVSSRDISIGGYSGWRGGIGITFGKPATKIPDVNELGYEVVWGAEDIKAVSALDIAMFKYWNGIVEVSLKGELNGAAWDFSEVPDKDKAAALAFDAWAEAAYGVKGLSKYATVRYFPAGNYGDVKGTMDLSSENPLVNAVIDTYLKYFREHSIKRGGIGIDNAATLPGDFLSILRRRLNPEGFGIAANCLPKNIENDPKAFELDVAGAEGFPFPVEFARKLRTKGFNGIFCEFTMQHLSASELAAYLKSKLFYGIVFFGYTDGGVAAASQYSFFMSRPDVYNHQRWIFRKYVPVSRALFAAGSVNDPCAVLAQKQTEAVGGKIINPEDAADSTGAIYEKGQLTSGLEKISGMSKDTPGVIYRFGDDIGKGIYYFVSSPRAETVTCDAAKLSLKSDTLVFDEFNEKILDRTINDSSLEFKTTEGPSVVQLGSKDTIVKNLVTRMIAMLDKQKLQQSCDKVIEFDPMLKIWASFCQGWTHDPQIARTGKGSMKLIGERFQKINGKWKYFNRQGGAQFIALNQTKPLPITLSAWSKADSVPASPLNSITDRRKHFICREDNIYAMHLYLDYQDGNWPEIHTVAFPAGTFDWEKRSITVNPKKPVKTAMVLFEFEQPSGVAWFDDISLVQADDGINLLACSGFEKDEVINPGLTADRKDYEGRIDKLRTLIENVKAREITPESLVEIRNETASIMAYLEKTSSPALWGREKRDLEDIMHLCDVCSGLCQGK